MKTPPPLLLAAALLFWGYETKLWTFALIFAALLELPHVLRFRWNFSRQDHHRMADACFVLMVGAVLYFYNSENSSVTVGNAYSFFQSLPIVFFPLVLGDLFSIEAGIHNTAFSWIARLRHKPGTPPNRISVGYLYLLTCLLSAGAANLRSLAYFSGASALLACAALALRPRTFQLQKWVLSIFFAWLAGASIALFLHEGQAYLMGKSAEWFYRAGRKEFDPNETRTTMGHLGSLKQSSRIVMHVKCLAGQEPPLLRQATYTELRQTSWLNPSREFKGVTIEADGASWKLSDAPQAFDQIQITLPTYRGAAMLSLPFGTFALSNLPANILQTNRLGAIKVAEAPGLLEYTGSYNSSGLGEALPDGYDLEIPKSQTNLLRQVSKSLQLSRGNPEETESKIANYFAKHFSYSLTSSGRRRNFEETNPLATFLLQTHAGHCEYFATATVLLLRASGIPARYVTGYAVSERGRFGADYIVRDRNAHAWAIAYIKGRWETIDNTPSSWIKEENDHASAFESISDLRSFLWFQYARWRWLSKATWLNKSAPWLLGAILLWMLGKLFLRRRHQVQTSAMVKWQGLDSEFYQIEKWLAQAGLGRMPAEPWNLWIHRVSSTKQATIELDPLFLEAKELHNRYRFDPSGLKIEQRDRLRELVRNWLSQRQKGEVRVRL